MYIIIALNVLTLCCYFSIILSAVNLVIYRQNCVAFRLPKWLVVGAVCLQFAQLARSLGQMASQQVSLCRFFLTSKLRANYAQTAHLETIIVFKAIYLFYINSIFKAIYLFYINNIF